ADDLVGDGQRLPRIDDANRPRRRGPQAPACPGKIGTVSAGSRMSHLEKKREILSGARRIVVKLGSNILTTASGVSDAQIGRISAELCALVEENFQVVVVTSGARAAGLARLGLGRIPKKIPEQQAAAAIGQIRLM